MGPESAKSFPGQQLVRALPDPEGKKPAERAKQEADYGRRGKGYVFGAFQPATGDAFAEDPLCAYEPKAREHAAAADLARYRRLYQDFRDSLRRYCRVRRIGYAEAAGVLGIETAPPPREVVR